MQTQAYFERPAIQNKPSYETSEKTGYGITEVNLSPFNHDEQAILLPMLAHLSHHQGDQWLTWISTHRPNKTLLQQYGFDLTRLRVIILKDSDNMRWVLWETLKNGNSHTVVANTPPMSKEEIKMLEQAASEGQTRALLVKNRAH